MSFIREMFSGASGEVSSKRTILFLLVLLFVSMVIVSQITQKTFDAILKEQLFWLIQTVVILVFGERAVAAWESVRGKVNIDKHEVKTTETTVKSNAADAPK